MAEAETVATADQPYCAGVRTSGYWKGYRCCATPKYQKNGKWYCKNHLPIEDNQQ